MAWKSKLLICDLCHIEISVNFMNINPMLAQKDDAVVYKIDVPANRYDLLCVEGVARALRCYLGLSEPSKFNLVNAQNPKETMIVNDEATKKIRPYVVCAILRNIKFDSTNYNSFISLQDKLHATVCRNRKFVAIGTHDYDTIKGPFLYEALPPHDIKFKALNQATEMNAVELMKLYENDLKLREFLGLIKDSPVYPVIYDSNRVVLSMPPIINGDHSKISLKTKNVFIECTALDLTKATIVLNEVICMYAQYSSTPDTCIEAVKVVYKSNGTTDITPKLQTFDMEVDLQYVQKMAGSSTLTCDSCIKLLKKMDLIGSKINETHFKATIPPHRADILHKCDIAEDIMVAYGFNNLGTELPKVVGPSGKQLPISKLCNEMRKVCTSAKFNECLTLCLTSKAEHYEKMQRPATEHSYVVLANPISKECDIARTSLLPGLIKCLKANTAEKLPIRLFEIGDVVLMDPNTETGTKNNKRLAALFCGQESGFENIHGLLDFIMAKLGNKPNIEGGYSIKIGNDPAFVENAQLEIILGSRPVGIMGIINPKVLEAFELDYPVSMIELNMDYLSTVFFSKNQ